MIRSSIDKLIIWDLETPPPENISVLSLNGYTETHLQRSVLKIIDENSDILRSEYLKLIYDLGELKIKGERIIEHLEVMQGLSLWWMTLLAEKNAIKSKTIQDCIRLMAIEIYLKDVSPDSIELHTTNHKIADSISILCTSLKISFYHKFYKDGKKDYGIKSIYKRSPYVIQGLMFLTYYVIKRWSLTSVKPTSRFCGESSIFIFSYFFNLDQKSCAKGDFYSRQWESFPEYLKRSGRKINWIHHYLFIPDGPDTSTAVRWINSFNRKHKKHSSHLFLDNFLSIQIIIKTLSHWVRFVSRMTRLNKLLDDSIKDHPRGWLWPILYDDWKNSVLGRVAVQNLLWIYLIDKAMANQPKQNLGLYLCENMDWERAFIYFWKNHGHGRLIAVPHATVRYWDLRYFDDPKIWDGNDVLSQPHPDQIAVNGPVAWETFRDANQPMDKMVQVEALRYLHLEKFKSIKLNTNNKKISKVNRKFELLMVGDLYYKTTNETLIILESAHEFLKEGYHLSFKSHPATPINLDDYPNLKIKAVDGQLSQILINYDIVVASVYTSASIEAASLGLPVITVLDNQDLNFSPLYSVPNTCFVSSVVELEQVLKNQYHNTIPINEGNYYWTNPDLPRWKKLLEFD